jgi:hypothetical protein
VTKNYAVRLLCPYGDEDTWVTVQNRDETLEQILKMSWDFECSLHGVQREMPIEAKEKGPPGGQARPAERSKQKAEQRSSKRASLQVPVVVYGWVKNQGAFHEETRTLLVNGSGGLVSLATKVDVGEMLFLVNQNTREEQECRVAYVQQEAEGEARVGLAFKRPVPGFWRTNPRKARLAKSLQVWVRGVDRNGNPFVQSAQTIDIGQNGARLDGVGYMTRPGAIIQVKRGWRKARFRVVWIGQMGTPQANQIGICCLEEHQDIWRVPVSQSEAGEAKRPSRS